MIRPGAPPPPTAVYVGGVPTHPTPVAGAPMQQQMYAANPAPQGAYPPQGIYPPQGAYLPQGGFPPAPQPQGYVVAQPMYR